MGMNETKTQEKLTDSTEPKGIVDIETTLVRIREPKHVLWKLDELNPVFSKLNVDDKNVTFFCRSVISLLNRLTPENFSTISIKMKTLPVDSSTKMQQVVEIIHKKAILEWEYRALYAKICDLMQNIEAVDELGIVKPFSLYLISNCETVFHESLSENFRSSNSSVKKYDEKKREIEKKFVGNCQFIGELFKVYLIHPKIILLMLDQLLKANGDVTVECACALLTTIGSFYEEKIGKLPATYFNELESLLLSDTDNISPRVRFIVQDVLDLKKNSWHPRKCLELTETCQEIEQEMIEKEIKSQELAESISGLDYILEKSPNCDKFEIAWADISIHFFKDIIGLKDGKSDNQANSAISFKKTHTFEDSVHSILDELTEDNFNLLAKTLKKLPINDTIRLHCVVDSIFEHAMNNPERCKLYAAMCHSLQKIHVPDEGKDVSSTMTLKTLIFNKCQQQFNIDQSSEFKGGGNESHRRSVVNCRFSGELFNVQVLSRFFLFHCIRALLKLWNAQSSECLYELLNVAGKNLLSEKYRSEETNQLFEEFENLLKNKYLYLSSEMKSLLEDLLYTNKNKKRVICGKIDTKNISDEKQQKDILAQHSDEFDTSKNDRNTKQAETNSPVSEVVEDYTVEYLVPVYEKIVEHSSINSPGKLSFDCEKLFGFVRADSCQKSNDNEVNISTVDSKKELVDCNRKKYDIEFLKSLRDLPECKKMLKVNAPYGTYTEYDYWYLGAVCTKILNEYVSKKSNLALQKLNYLPIDDVFKLQYIVDLIYFRAIDQPQNFWYYVKVVRTMNFNIPDESRKTAVPFRISCLISRCQQVFEREITKELNVFERQKEIDLYPDMVTSIMKQRLVKLFVRDVCDFRQTAVGNCRWIYALFKHQMLTQKITFRCIDKLLESADDISLECLCKLLLDIESYWKFNGNETGMEELELIYEKMKDFLKNEKYKLPPRIKLMMQDMIFEKKRWRIAADENTPKWKEKHNDADDFLLYISESTNVLTKLGLDRKHLLAEEKETREFYEPLANCLKTIKPKRFDSIAEQIVNLPINNLSRLQGVVDSIYNWAMHVPRQCFLYAELCHKMQKISVFDDDTGKTYVFIDLFLSKCHQEFERNRAEELDKVEIQKNIHVCADPVSKEVESTLEKTEKFRQKSSLGNCQLISELFKKCLITFEAVFVYIDKLSESTHDVSLECLCILLKKIGKHLQSDKLEVCFEKMRKLLKDKTYQESSEVRSMLQEVIDLKENDWVPIDEDASKADDCDKKFSNEKSNGSEKVEVHSEIKILPPNENLDSGSSISSGVIDVGIDFTKKKIVKEKLRSIFMYWAQNENFPPWFESEKHNLISRVLPRDISKLIKIVLKVHSQKAAKCGQFLACLIKDDHIPSKIISTGFGYFLYTMGNKKVPAEFEFILSPSFEYGCLQLDDFNTVFRFDSDMKSVEDEERDRIVLRNNSAPKEHEKNHPSSSQPKIINIPAEKPPVPPPHFDAFSCVTSSASDLSVQNSKNDDVKSKPIHKQVEDLLKKQTSGEFKLPIFKLHLKRIRFETAAQLESTAFCVIKMVEENPNLCIFYAKLCCPMMMLQAEKMKFWMLLMRACNTNFHQKIFPKVKNSCNKSTSKEQIKTEKSMGFCKFFALIVNTLNNETANRSVQRIMKNLIDVRKIEYFCEIYNFLDHKKDRLEKTLFESCIPKLLSSNELEVESQNMLRGVVEDYAKNVAFCTIIVPATNNQQHRAAVTKQEISPKCDDEQNVTKSSSLPKEKDIISSSVRKTTDDTTNKKAVLSDGNLSISAPSTSSVIDTSSNPKKKKKKKKKKAHNVSVNENNELVPMSAHSVFENKNDEFVSMSRNEISRTVDDVLVELRSHPNSSHELAKRISSIPINKESLLTHVILRIYSNAMKDDEFGRTYVELCEHLQNWCIIDNKTGKQASFKSLLIVMIHLKCNQIKGKIGEFNKNGQAEEDTRYDLHGRIAGYFRFLCEFLKSPVYGHNLLIFPALKLVLLLDTIVDSVLDLLKEFLKILLDDLDLKLLIILDQLRSSNYSSELFGKYNVMFKIIVTLQDMIDFKKYPGRFVDGDNQILKNEMTTRGKNVDSFLKKKPDFVENIFKHIGKRRENPEDVLDSIIGSMCSYVHLQSKIEKPQTDISEEFSFALLLKYFGEKVPSFESHCINTAIKFTKKSNFSPEIVSKVFEFLLIYEIIPYGAFVEYKNAVVTNQISEMIKILNSSTFKLYKLSESPQA